MKWDELLETLKTSVPAGYITTYGDLSEHFKGHRGAGQAIRAMLQAAVNHDYRNSRLTNRVVHTDGKVAEVNGQLYQLEAEGVEIKNGCVVLENAKRASFT